MLADLNEILLVQQFDQLHQVAVLIASASGVEDFKELRSVDVVKGLLEVDKDEEVLPGFAMAVKFLEGECDIGGRALARLEAVLISPGHQQMTVRFRLKFGKKSLFHILR